MLRENPTPLELTIGTIRQHLSWLYRGDRTYWNSWLDSDSLTNLKTFDIRANLDNLASSLVTKGDRFRHDIGTDTAVVPHVYLSIQF
jgi:hypothetical protein